MRTPSPHLDRIPLIALACVLAVALAPPNADAQVADIPVANHSFEADPAAPNSFPVLIPSGWQAYDPGGIIDQAVDAIGVLNPTGGTFFPAAPDGSNVALLSLSGDRGTTPVGIMQTLSHALQPNTTYALRVEVGNIASGIGAPPFAVFFNLDGFPGYAVELLAGGEVLAADVNSLGDLIPEGAFRTSTVTFSTDASHPRLGMPLAIRLINLNLIPPPPDPGIEVDFDLVRLTAQPRAAPCPADFDASGTLDPDDLSDFIACYFSSPPCDRADFDAGGTPDPDDLADFIAAYFAGCD
ncbi:MAG: hypothetical protein JNK35_00080 [Phycisphaerae bacterium]|nr:hypothetical protein [Phycisphaerae bacterium]